MICTLEIYYFNIIVFNNLLFISFILLMGKKQIDTPIESLST